MKKIFFSLLCSMLVLSGCSKQTTSSTTTSSTTSSNESSYEVVLSDIYDNLPNENQFDLMEKDDLKTFIEHGTGILYFSFPECPWCQAYIPMLNEVLENNDVRAYYYNIHVDKDDDRDFYDEIAQLLIDHNKSDDENVVLYGNDGKPLIYMPLVLFIENGEIKSWNGESNTNDSDEILPEDYWTTERVTNLKNVLDESIKENKEAQEENDAKGCDTGCSYGS